MIDWKQEIYVTTNVGSGWLTRRRRQICLAKPPADYRAENVADLLANRRRMSLGQTVRLPELVLYDYRQDDSDNSLYHLKLRDGTGELMARAFPNNRNDNMRESLAESIACVGRGGIMHFPILANGSSAIYTPLTEEHPFYLVSFTRAESTEPSRRKEFELTPVKRFGDMHPDEL